MTDGRTAGEAGTWEQGFAGHEQAQLERLARLPLREKLRWLEEAHRLVLRLASRDARSAPVAPGSASDDR